MKTWKEVIIYVVGFICLTSIPACVYGSIIDAENSRLKIRLKNIERDTKIETICLEKGGEYKYISKFTHEKSCIIKNK